MTVCCCAICHNQQVTLYHDRQGQIDCQVALPESTVDNFDPQHGGNLAMVEVLDSQQYEMVPYSYVLETAHFFNVIASVSIMYMYEVRIRFSLAIKIQHLEKSMNLHSKKVKI